MSWRKEKAEHPWTTKTQAKRIAKDHTTKKPIRHLHRKHNIGPIQTATQDFTSLYNGTKRIAYQEKP